jgi:hypothetical protein
MKSKKKIFFLFIIAFFFSQNLSAEQWKRVYLASYPRSGNHWVRYLVEEASHIATSAANIDRDPPHMGNMFPWGGYCCNHGYEGNCRYPVKSDYVLIKTHYPTTNKRGLLPAKKYIRIVRHPVDSFFSWFLYGRRDKNQTKIPSSLLKLFIQKWKDFQEYWNKQESVLTIRYEDLSDHPFEYLSQILNFVEYKVQSSDVERAVKKYPCKSLLYKHLNNFNLEERLLIASELGELMNEFGYTIPLD